MSRALWAGALLGLLIAAGPRAWAQAPTDEVPLEAVGPAALGPRALTPQDVTAELSQSEVTLGSPFTLTLTIHHPSDQRWELAAGDDLGAFSLLSQGRVRKDEGDTATTTFTLGLSLFELGAQTLAGLPFEVATPEGTASWTSAPVQVTGLTSLPDDVIEKGEALRGDQGPEDVPVLTLRLLWYALGLIALALLTWLLIRWWRSRPPKAVPPPVLAPLPVRTREALLALRAERLPEAGELKAFHSRLSEILRGYVGERYGVEAMESTTYELVSGLARTTAPPRVVGVTRTLLEESDLVKFAKLQMDPSACDAAIDAALGLVDAAEAAAAPAPVSETGASDAP